MSRRHHTRVPVLVLVLVLVRTATTDRAGDSFPCPPGSCLCQDVFGNASITVVPDVPYAVRYNPLTRRNQTLYLDQYLPPTACPSPRAAEHSKTRSATASTLQGRGQPQVTEDTEHGREVLPPRPAAILIHGGGFSNASSANGKRGAAIKQRAYDLARRGFVVVSIDYRCLRAIGGTALWVDAVADARTALSWLVAHTPALHVDPSRIVAYGTSAGAVTVAGLCFMWDPPPTQSPSPAPTTVPALAPRLAAGISISGCLFNDTTSLPAGRHVWNRLYAAGPHNATFVDFHGTADPVVPYRNASQRPASLGRRNQSCSAVDTQGYLSALGAPNFLVPIPGAGHVPITSLNQPPYNTSFWGFLAATVRPAPATCAC